jgi:hypothetical protein
MTREHYILLAGFLAVVAMQVSTLEHWREGTSPQFIAGVIGQVAIVLRAIYTEKPAP